jgi:hypothetical protein
MPDICLFRFQNKSLDCPGPNLIKVSNSAVGDIIPVLIVEQGGRDGRAYREVFFVMLSLMLRLS